MAVTEEQKSSNLQCLRAKEDVVIYDVGYVVCGGYYVLLRALMSF